MALDSIIAHKRDEVRARKGATPEAEVKRGLAKSDRSLRLALGGDATGFILECKKASPSKGTIRKDYDPVALATAHAIYANAISVLTDSKFFGGSLEDLRAVRDAVDRPVLQKDFIIDPYQVYEARSHGADAILLIMAAIDDATAAACVTAAGEFEMDLLVEVRSEEELERALRIEGGIIGINSRDLRTLEVDLRAVERLAPLVPEKRIVVAESGVRTHSDVRMLRPNVDAFLIGQALMESADPLQATREVVFGRVKVCGLTREEDALTAERSGATSGGVIFAKGSPRRVDSEQAWRISSASGLKLVGVFADEEISRVDGLARDLDLNAVQLHGDETREYVESLRARLPVSCEIWKAERVADELPAQGDSGADRILLDTYVEGTQGGTGRSFDWSILEGQDLSRVIVGGGLAPSNAAKADALGAWALDVNSGVESAPGIKDGTLMDEFFSKLRGTGRRGL